VTREEKREALLDVLKGQPRVWLSADAVTRGYLAATGLRLDWKHPDYLSVIAVGRILSQLAREGKIAKMHTYMGYYRWVH
jgi:hypothetical protein